MAQSPYPAFYTPQGMPRPAACPHNGPLGVAKGQGPDWNPDAKTGGEGLVWGGVYDPKQVWAKTSAGYYIRMMGQRPQDLIRVARHPRVITRRRIEGVTPEQSWSVPVLMREVGPKQFAPCIDGIWDGTQWTQADLTPAYEQLLLVANDIELAPELEDRNRLWIDLAVTLCQVDQWVDLPMMTLCGWISELFLRRVMGAAFGLPIGEEF